MRHFWNSFGNSSVIDFVIKTRIEQHLFCNEKQKEKRNEKKKRFSYNFRVDMFYEDLFLPKKSQNS